MSRMFPVTENLIPSGLVAGRVGWFTGKGSDEDTARLTSLPDHFKFFDNLLWFVLQLLNQSGNEFGLLKNCSCPRGRSFIV